MTEEVSGDEIEGRKPFLGRPLQYFSDHPWLGLVSCIASVFGAVFGVGFAIFSVRSPELTYELSPVRTVIVKTGELSSLSVSMDGDVIESDVTSVQLAIWNQGRKPIRSVDILKPLRLQIGEEGEILSTTLRNITRGVVSPSAVLDGKDRTSVGVKWDILEQGDGFIVQIVYTGGVDVPIDVGAVVVGQQAILEYEKGKLGNRLLAFVLFWSGYGVLVCFIANVHRLIPKFLKEFRDKRRFGMAVYRTGIVVTFTAILLGLVLIFIKLLNLGGAPFDF